MDMDSTSMGASEMIPGLSVAQSLPENMMTPLVMTNPSDGNLLILLCGQSNQDDLTTAGVACVDEQQSVLNESAFSAASILQSAVQSMAVSSNVNYTSVTCPSQRLPAKDTSHLARMMSASSAAILLSCSYCSKLFLSYRHLTQHVNVCRRNIKPYHCIECHTGFKKAAQLYLHQLGHAGITTHDTSEGFSGNEIVAQRMLQCKSCGKTYQSSSGLRRHRKSGKCLGSRATFIEEMDHTPVTQSLDNQETIKDDVTLCCSCGKVCDTPHDLQRHAEQNGCASSVTLTTSASDETPLDLTCSKEKEGAESLISLQHNQTSDLSTEGTTLEQPKGSRKRKGAPVKVSLKLISKRRTTGDHEKRFKCDQCDKSFGKEYYLNKHRHVHGNAMPFSCASCDKSFLSSIKYKEHCSIHGENKPFKCDLCGKGFAKMEVLRIHNRTHTGERPFECKECGKSFKQSSNLRDHARKHADIRPFACSVCDKAFTLKGDLTKHSKIHTGEKPFECDFCGMAFPRMSNLTRHRRKHTGEKPYTCDFCGKSFSRHEKCVEHRRTHTGERPYTCEICGKTFKDSGNFCNHKKIHCLEKPRRRRSRSTKSCQPNTTDNSPGPIGDNVVDGASSSNKEASQATSNNVVTHQVTSSSTIGDHAIPVAVGGNCDASVQTQGGYVMQVGNILGSLELALGQLHNMNQDQYLALQVNDPRLLNILQVNTDQQQMLTQQQEATQCIVTQDGQPAAMSIDPSALQGYLTLVSALQNAQPGNGTSYVTQVNPNDVANLATVDLSNVVCDTSHVVCENQEVGHIVADGASCEESSLSTVPATVLDEGSPPCSATEEVEKRDEAADVNM